jgi:hypothetical protein
MILEPTWSLNRVVVADLPGVELPGGVKGKLAYELVSAQRLTQMIREQATALRLDSAESDHRLRLAFDACLVSTDPIVRGAALEIARTLGCNLGYVLLTLKRGDAVNRFARPEWCEYHWARWGSIERVWLGGGLISGNLGGEMVVHAARLMQESGYADFTVKVAPFAAELPLIGAARHLPPDVNSAVVLDFGSSRIKSARVSLRQGWVVALRRFPSLPVRWPSVNSLDDTTPERVQLLIDGMTSTIADAWRRARAEGVSVSRMIPVCLAAYVAGGNPLRAQAGVYMQTNLITHDLEGELSRRVSARLRHLVRVRLFHDGTAAASNYAGERRSAVITLGTALGIGFPDDEGDLRGIHTDFHVTGET